MNTKCKLGKRDALDHYVHFGFLPNDVDVDGHVFDYETYNYLIDLFHPDFHKIAVKKRLLNLGRDLSHEHIKRKGTESKRRNQH